MLIPNLTVLLAERRLTISRASQDTRISRTTLTALCSGAAKGIQFDTLNALCQYLKTTPGEFFLYRPFDLAIACDARLGRAAVAFTLRRAGREERISLPCDAQYLPPSGDAPATLRVRLAFPEGDPRAQDLADLLRALPAPALADLEFDILRAFDPLVPTPASDYSPELLWPWQP